MKAIKEEERDIGLSLLFSERIGGKDFGKNKTLYKFQKIKNAKLKAQELNPGVEFLDFGIGEPDEMADGKVIEVLSKAAKKYDNRVYPDSGGMIFREAAGRFMKREFGVELDLQSEIVHCIGAKSALALLPHCFINQGDYVIVTSPGYPVFASNTEFIGGKVFSLPLLEENGYLPDFNTVPESIISKAKVLLINYPNNPTGGCATREFLESAVRFCVENNIILINDAAYSHLVYEGELLSILSIPGGRDVGLEIYSMSKNFNMTGWRLGWVCGNERLVKAFVAIKDSMDSGQFLAIQEAGAYALSQMEIPDLLRVKYGRRLGNLSKVLREIGFDVKDSRGTFFLYCKAPKKIHDKIRNRVIEFESAEAFSQWLILERQIVVVPWDDAGSYVRFSVTFYANTVEEEGVILQEMGRRLSSIRVLVV